MLKTIFITLMLSVLSVEALAAKPDFETMKTQSPYLDVITTKRGRVFKGFIIGQKGSFYRFWTLRARRIKIRMSQTASIQKHDNPHFSRSRAEPEFEADDDDSLGGDEVLATPADYRAAPALGRAAQQTRYTPSPRANTIEEPGATDLSYNLDADADEMPLGILSAELGSAGLWYTVSWEHFLGHDFTIRGGIGGVPVDGRTLVWASVMGSYIGIGGLRHKLDLGAGAMAILAGDTAGSAGQISVGYRYVPRPHGVSFRVAATPLLTVDRAGDPQVQPRAEISVGFAF